MMSSPSPAELENLSILFGGFIVATFLYGLTVFQTYIYFYRYPNDYKWTRVLAGLLLILDTTSTVLVTQVSYHDLIQMFDVEMEVVYATPTSCAQGVLSSIVILITQIFFAGRLYTVCGGPAVITSKVVTLAVCFSAVIGFVFGLTLIGQIFEHRHLSVLDSPPITVIAAINQGFGTAAFIIIFIAMCWSLRQTRYPDMAMPDGLLDNIIAVWINRGLILAVIQLASLATFIASPAKPYWMVLQVVICRVCSSALLGLLNAREVRRGVGYNAEETLSNLSVTNDALPSLNFRLPTSTKATQQTVNFSTQQSGEIEEAKSYQDDENLGSIHSQCSEQPEAKARSSSELDVAHGL